MTTTELWLVRHARPLVAEGTCYGRLDVLADPAHTRDSARALAEALHTATEGNEPAIPVWTSPLSRAAALARELIHAAPPALRLAEPQYDARLAEMDFGTWEGRRWDDIPAAELAAWTDDFQHHRPGGGEHVAGFLARVQAAWLATAVQCQAHGQRHAVWVTHAGVIRAMERLQSHGLAPLIAQAWPTHAPGFGQWVVRSIRLPALA